jgi:pseudouridine-5'-phosphate glycosidase
MVGAIRSEGAVAAVCAVLNGYARVGLTASELNEVVAESSPVKISLRDLATACWLGQTGGTTVAATIHLASRAGIKVFATGGIGGVHRGHPEDVSADLPAMAKNPVVVVCSGAKSILDIGRTLELLETLAVPVLGYRTTEFPAFYSPRSGYRVDARTNSAADVAEICATRAALGQGGSIVLAVPVPDGNGIPFEEAERFVVRANQDAEDAGVSGNAVTPYLLQRIVELSDGRAERANGALLENNARVAAQVARAICMPTSDSPAL